MSLTKYIGTKLKNTGPLIGTLRLVYSGILHLKALIELIMLMPKFYMIYITNSRSRNGYKTKHLVDELIKVSDWHSNFLGLIDFWKLDREFNDIFNKASKTQGNHVLRCFMLYQLLKQVSNLEGEVAEVGVHRGRSAKVISLTSERFSKKVFLFDTFTGMPEVDPDRDNCYTKGAFSDTSLREVSNFLSECRNVTIYPGLFPDTAEPIQNTCFSFVHVDVDIYQSVLDCCRFFYPRMVSRGIILFDDPGFADCSGAKIAVDEFFSNKEEFPIYLATAQAIIIKR